MRISTIQAFNTGIRGIQDNYSAVTRTQEQITSGKRILSPADDPVASVRLLQLGQEASKLAQYKDNLTAATNSLTQEEAVLNSVNNILQRVREIALEAGNGALDASGREALAQELAERENELYGLLNSQNARGEYLFGGYQSDTQPFVKNPDGSYSYAGDEGQRSIQIGSAKMVAINDNGKELFVDVGNVNRVDTAAGAGNAGSGRISLGVVENKGRYDSEFYPQGSVSIVISDDAAGYEIRDAAGAPLDPPVTGTLEPNAAGGHEIRYGGVVVTLDGEPAAGDEFTISVGTADNSEKRGVLDTVRLLRDTLENTDDSPEGKLQRRDMLAISVQNLDNAMNQVLGVQTSLGARLNVIESAQLENDEATLINTTVQSGLEDLDYAEALSRLSMESIVLQAAQQSFVKVSGLSLFNFLR
ncbi:flagellar hook-associated protein 3 [Pseudomonas sp. G11-1]|uniref:Flagellar hook-associated protein 3 FlgL n=1 Tax=Halopseudomonas bauzanensis TaxID=653930 RepID=A0A031MF83_9GAMM|nr:MULTISPECIES: flagellar hook-associated protein FlgL [Halopseudomonas]MCO5786348.1 flagellar hook-associated protein 3 [Pseudomonas sp. G11-1]MCO5789574.1 flagellar hook-associated protein 3 [Pseudomonas sp. G11-2]EZQ18454.1 flagellar hook protein FlgL [Halopseudomonas bauzanensis]WGK62731.1 flagellar hook-associated protein FlgL [Halopseudomonas sp. SMJS2]SES19494.1 flagellar hook-associated protein 3 FlgL [Halopseudomonas bauzanensis]